MILTVRPATRADAEWIAPRLRDEDRREIEDSTGLPPMAVVLGSLDTPGQVYTIRLSMPAGFIDDNPSVIFGCAPDPQRYGMGIMWLLATPDVKLAPISVLREAHFWIDSWCRQFPDGVHNLVDQRNHLHLRWLRCLGFSFPETIMVRGHAFVHAMRCDHV